MVVSHALKSTLNFLLPPRCMSCEEEVAVNHMLCAGCWSAVTFITDPKCTRCGFPFELDYEGAAPDCEEDTLCGSCVKEPPQYDQAQSVFAYGGKVKSMVLALKYADATYLAPGFAQFFYPRFKAFVDPVDLILPVPIHRRRLLKRMYNQAGLLAASLGRATHKPVDHFMLTRTKNTQPQGKLTKFQRKKNVAGVVSLKGTLKPNAHILLVDDVLTTGSTVNECAKVLKKAGAKKVDILTIARVV